MNKTDRTRLLFTTSLAQTSRAYKSLADRLASDYGLSQATALPAVMIGRHGNRIRPGELADMLRLDPSSIVRIIDQLVESGIVNRTEDPVDRRARVLSLTSSGKETISRVEQTLMVLRNNLLEHVPLADLETCLRVLGTLNQAVRDYEQEAAGKI
ncbi:MAG: MarR family transcriptional regulator [Burkholderiaceae bacterium]|jgi:MarR family transcriptional regulator for hemolysin|nr:MarR family transcriptional regulator [Burkholderiaceae bacterium]